MSTPAKPFSIAYIGQSERNISFFLFVIHVCNLKGGKSTANRTMGGLHLPASGGLARLRIFGQPPKI